MARMNNKVVPYLSMAQSQCFVVCCSCVHAQSSATAGGFLAPKIFRPLIFDTAAVSSVV